MSKNKKVFNKKSIIYIEAIVYVISIIVVIFSNIFGPLYLTMLPLLTILGVVGAIIFKRQIITTIFGLMVSLCIAHLKGLDIYTNICVSMVYSVNILLGELIGYFILKIYKKKEKKFYYIYFGLILVITIIFNAFTTSNIFTFNVAKKDLSQYIENTYNEKDRFDFLDSSYYFLPNRYYDFTLLDKRNGNVAKFKVLLDDTKNIQDKYKEKILAKDNISLYSKFQNYLYSSMLLDKYQGYGISVSYTEIDKLSVKINKKLDSFDNYDLDKFASDIVNILTDLKAFDGFLDIENIDFIIENKINNEKRVSSILLQNYILNLTDAKNYILKSFDVEYID